MHSLSKSIERLSNEGQIFIHIILQVHENTHVQGKFVDESIQVSKELVKLPVLRIGLS